MSWRRQINHGMLWLCYDVKTLIENYAKKYGIHEWCAAALIATRVGKNIIRTELFKNKVKQYCFRKLLWKARKECKSKKLARIHVRQTRHCRDEFDAVYGQEKIIDATILPNKDIYMIMEMKIPQSSKIFEQIRKLDHSSEKRIDFHSSERMHGDTHSFRIEVTDKRILLFRRQPLDYRSSRIIVESFTFDGRTDSSFALEGQFTISDFSSIDIDDSGQIVCNTGEDRREFSADGKEL